MLDVWEPLGPVPPWETVGRSPVMRGSLPCTLSKCYQNKAGVCYDHLKDPSFSLISFQTLNSSVMLDVCQFYWPFQGTCCILWIFFVFHFPDVCSLFPSSVCFTFILPFSCQVLQDGCLDNWLRLFLFSNMCIQCSEFSFQHCFSCNPPLLMSCSFISFWFSAFFNFPGDFLFKSWFM